MPPNTPEVKVLVPNESSMSKYYRFAQVVLSMAPIEGFEEDFDLGVEQVDSDPPNKARVLFVFYADNALWNYVMKTKNLQPELLRWHLRLKEFDFVVWDKVNVHTLSYSEQA